MKKITTSIIAILFVNVCFGQIKLSTLDNVELAPNNLPNKITLTGAEDGGVIDKRTFLLLNNTRQSNGSLVNIQLKAGSSSSSTLLTHASSSYGLNTFGSDYADFGQLWGTGAGLIIRAGGPTIPGVIKFQNGSTNSGGAIERMRIQSNGYIGIGTNTPTNLLSLESNAGAGSNDRFLLSLNNTSDLYDSGAILKINAGTGGSSTFFSHHSPSYSLKSSFANNGQVFSLGTGLLIRVGSQSNPNASIKFLTGNNSSGTGFERMRINEIGYVGIGDFDQNAPNNSPKSKLHIQNGDVYLENSLSGVILKSPNGSCFRLTIADSGQIVSTGVVCPN